MSVTHLAAIGWSASPNAATAGQVAARLALTQLGRQRVQGAIVFASSWFEQSQLLAGVSHVLQTDRVIGGSTAGEITPEGPTSHSCVVLALAENGLALSVGSSIGIRHNPRLAGYSAAQQALQHFTGRTRCGFIMFGDGLSTGYAEVVHGIQEVLGTSSLVTGGLMGDDLRFTMTSQYAAGHVLTEGLAGLLLGGACTMGVGIGHGFAPIGKPLRVTRASGNELFELNDQPASRVYEDYFGPLLQAIEHERLSRRLIAYPLGIQLDRTGEFLLRHILGFGDDGRVLCTGEIPEGAWAQVMIGSKELALEAAEQAARAAMQPIDSPCFVLVFDSALRKRLLGSDAKQDIMRIRRVIGPMVPMVGCYTYGEQAPLGSPYPYGRSSIQSGSVLVIAVGHGGGGA